MTTPNHRKITRGLLAFLAAAGTAHAVGTVRQSTDQVGNTGIYMVSLYWTGDSVNGTVPVTLIQSQNIPVVQGYRVVNVETVPGSPAPTNGYSLTLLDAAGVDVLAGAASGLSSSSAAGFAGSATSPPIYGSLSLSITGQSVVGAKGTVFVYLAPFSQVIGLAPTTPNFPSQGADLVFASPCNSTGSPGFRALCAQDLTLAGLLAANNTWTANNTYTGGIVDLHGSTKTLPNRSGTGSPNGRDNCATVGETYFQTDAVAGLNIWGCTTVGSPGVWTLAGTPLPAGTQTQVLRLQPNTGNNSTLQFASLPSVVANDFFFPAQTPGGSLSIGANTITLTPCPLGVNGADTGHNYYIQGGVGTAEAVTGTGGSCTAGASSGTLTFTAAHTHTGAWTISSATGGIQEAQQFLSAIGGTINITVGVTLHAAVNAIPTTPIRFTGLGNQSVLAPVIRGSDYANGDLFSSNVSGATFYGWDFDNMQIKGSIGSAVTGADVHITNNNINMYNSELSDSQYGLLCNGCTGSIVGTSYVQTDYSFTPQAAVFLGTGTAVTQDMLLTNMVITGSSLGNAQAMNAGIQIQGTDTVVISNSQISGGKEGLLIDGTVAANFNVNDTFSGLSIIDNTNYGILASGNADACNKLLFSGINVIGDNQVSSSIGQSFGINWGSGGTSCTSGIEFNGGSVNTFGNHGVLIFAPMSFQNFNVNDNNVSNSAGQSGISIKAGQTGVFLSGNNIYNSGVGHQAFGILTNGAFTGTILGNDLSGNVTAPISVGGQMNGIFAYNKGISDVIGSVADAATIIFPVNSNFVITGVGTGITAVNMFQVPIGQQGILRTTGGALTFTAGGGIGNTCTTTQNVPVPWVFDGTNVWLKC